MDIITIINDFLKKNNYTLLFHSTSNYDTAKMILEEGLLKGYSHYYEDKRNVLDEVEIPNPHLEQLVRQSTKTGKYSTIQHYYRLNEEYEKELPRRDTVRGFSELEPKKLKEYNHKDGTGTVVLCVPAYKYDHATKDVDRYLRATVSYGIDEDDIINQFQVRFLYPKEAILFIYDRINNTIKFNEEFDETFYFSQRSSIKKGSLISSIKEFITRFKSNEER